MEKGKSVVAELAASFSGIQVTPRRKPTSSILPGSAASLYSPVKKARPRKLVDLCIGVLGQHLEDIIADISELTAFFPPQIKGFHSTRILPKRERLIEVANGIEAEVEAVGDIPLELADGSSLLLKDVLFVPSIHRNLISVSCLDKDSYECYFGHGKCAIWLKDTCVGLATLHDKLYLLSLHEKVFSVCDVNEQVHLSNKDQKKRKRTLLGICVVSVLAILSIARRRRLLNDEVLVSLADSSWKVLDLSGSDVTDVGLATVAHICSNLWAVDISRCEKITAAAVSEIICHCPSLEILRCGGCPRSEFTARGCVNLLKPKLNTLEEDSWEELEAVDIGGGAESLRWLVWPKIDEYSKEILVAECPRVIVNPQRSLLDLSGSKTPSEALASVALDHSIVEDIDPKTWAVSAAPQRAAAPPRPNAPPEIPIAERFRLAYVSREARLAPKRARRERQHRRRAEREYWMNDIDAKSVALASKYLSKS